MQFLVAAALLAAIVGYSSAGIPGSITGALTAAAVVSGCAVALGRSATGAAIPQPADPWHRRGGFLAAVGSLLLSLRYGWQFGWLGAIAGYASGMLAGLVAAALSITFTRRRRRPDDRIAGVTGPFDLENERHVRLIDRIREDYSRQLADESGPYAECWFKPAAILPHPKETIRQALNTLLDFVEGRRQSPYLDQAIRSREVASTIRACLAVLDRYLEIPESELPTDPEENRKVGLAILGGATDPTGGPRA
ncbi:hypothetical protein HRbin33_01364 [bacterium HR33]|nr:hypothetical protein HRbin33_01364 [bacterium HR33]